MDYPHKTLLLNGRRIALRKIKDGTVRGDTPFEVSTLAFIKKWLEGKDRFYLNTSGSTGLPKKITASRNQFESSARLTIQFLGLKKKGTIFLCIDTQYIGGVMMLVRAFINKMKIEAIDPTSLKNFTKLPPCDLIALVPLQVQRFCQIKGSFRNFNKSKNIIIGGAALSEEDASILSQCKTNIFTTYGMTETFSHIALKRVSPQCETSFRVLPSIIINTDARNCLIIKTPFLKKEIITNDLVEITDTSSFKWLGRYDHVINTGGIKVIPEQLEIEILKVAQSQGIQNRFYAKAEPDKQVGEKIVLVLEGKKMEAEKERLFLTALQRELPRYHVPKKITYKEQFKLVNNKIKRE